MKRILILGIISLISTGFTSSVPNETNDDGIREISLAVAKIEDYEIINNTEEQIVEESKEVVKEEIVQEPIQEKQYRERDYIEQIIYDVSNTYDFPELLLQAIIYAESNFDPNCIGPDTYYGNAHGLMQLLPSTAESLGVTDIFDPYQNVDAGTRYMMELIDIYDDEQYYDHLGNVVTPYEMAVMAYNWGYGNLNNHLSMHGLVVIDEDSEYGIPHETFNYLSKIRNYCKEGKLTYEL